MNDVALRLSGILWSFDPLHISRKENVKLHRYDKMAQQILSHNWGDINDVTVPKFLETLIPEDLDPRLSDIVLSFLAFV